MSDSISPLATPFPALPQIAGATPRVARAGYKDWGRCDLTYVELSEGTAVAGVFSRKVSCSSEVELGRKQVKAGPPPARAGKFPDGKAFPRPCGHQAGVENIREA